MSERDGFGKEYFRMLENMRIMQANETMVDLIRGRATSYDLLDALTFNSGMENYPTEFVEYVESSDDYDDDDDDDDDDDEDEEESGNKKNRYCGFNPNFLDRGVSKHLSPYSCIKPVKHISAEEAAKIAKELVDEEEKLKIKAEKKKQKKMRQRERRRLEKLEKENADKNKNKKVVQSTDKSKASDKENENTIKSNKNSCVPPDPGPQNSVTIDNSESSEEEKEDNDNAADDIQELDMNSCFVTNAAAIAKRKLDQKPKSARKGKKAENQRKQKAEKESVAEAVKNDNEEVGSGETTNYFVTKSMELAVIGNSYAQTGNLDMAVKQFTEAIKHNPKEFKLFGNRSFCYEKMQQYEKALIDADIALSLNPTWIKGLYRKGKALVGLKRYYEACLIYKEVLKLDSSCTDAAQELMRVQIMQLMDMGFTREQSSNALIIHGTVEKALDALSGLQGKRAAAPEPSEVHVEEGWIQTERNQPPKVPLRTVLQNQHRATAVTIPPQELFPIWVGDLVPAISQSKVYELFNNIGPVHSVKVLLEKRCAFVNYTNKEDCEKAIKAMHGYAIAGTTLVVRYPDRIHSHLGASKTASTDMGKVSTKLPNECFFWRTTGCIKNNRCSYRHVPEHKGIDRPKAK
ncbi:RNA polymerase II-associated protein 3 isoform X2 [Hoplias malabaricus]|uniref:RNA polymerase II-associated protein 3 isoform X2 n=1 Tax=Hoplias malabaricus TaxID=27720 RepID=UPI00346265A4